jgi:hypothetical protein
VWIAAKVGSFRAIWSSRTRPVACWTFAHAKGKAVHYAATSSSSPTSIQARRRKHSTQACRPRTPMHVEHEYFPCGAWTYIAALDVHHARIFGRCEPANGIAPFGRLV